VFRAVGEVASELKAGFASGQSSVDTKGVPHIRPMNITEKGQFTWDGLKQIATAEYAGKEDYALRSGDVLFNNTNSKELVGKTCLIEQDINGGFSNHMTRIRVKPDMCVPRFLALLLHNAWQKGVFLELANRWVGQAGINATALSQCLIPLPPLEVQKQIVAEIEGYQNVINGGRAVLDHYRPHIPIHPDWPMVEIGELCTIERGASPRPIHDFITAAPDGVNWIKIGDAEVGGKYITATKERVTLAGAAKSRRVKPGDFVLSNSMSFGRPYIMATDGCIHDGWLLLRDQSDRLNKDFLYNVLRSALVFAQFEQAATGGVVNNLNSEIVRRVKIPLPPLATQQAIVAEIEAEQALVAANGELITRFEQKIQATLSRIWGEETGDTPK
jgi:restriction endonuclease S subunit